MNELTKKKLMKTNTCVDIKTFESKGLYKSIPKFVRKELDEYDNLVNPFLNIITGTKNINNIDSFLDNGKITVNGNYDDFKCKIRMQNEKGILCYRYDYLGADFILYTKDLKVMHRYRCPDNKFPGEIIYANKDGEEKLFRINKNIEEDDILELTNILEESKEKINDILNYQKESKMVLK